MSLLNRNRCAAAGALVLTLALAPAASALSSDLDTTTADAGLPAIGQNDGTPPMDENGPEHSQPDTPEAEAEPSDAEPSEPDPSDTAPSGADPSDTPPSGADPSEPGLSEAPEPPDTGHPDSDPADLESQVHVPDPALRACLLDEVAAAGHPPEDGITADAMADLWQIRCPSAGVRDLTGLENAAYLATLKLSDNDITDLTPLAGLAELVYIDLSYNAISDLSALAGAPWLDQVMLGHNELTDIAPLAELPSLFSVNLEGNQISDISPLSESQQLGSVILDFNPVADLSPLIGKSLFRLSALDIGLTDIEVLRQVPTVEALSIGNIGWYFERELGGDIIPPDRLVQAATHATPNRITDFSPLASMTGLRELKAGGLDLTELATLTPHLTPGLDTIDVQGNHLSDLTALAALPGLTQVSAEWQTIELPSTTVGAATGFAPIPLGNTPVELTPGEGPVSLTANGWTFTSAGSAELSWIQTRQNTAVIDPAWPSRHYTFGGTVRQQATDPVTEPDADPSPGPDSLPAPPSAPDPGTAVDERPFRSEVLAANGTPELAATGELATTGAVLTTAWIALTLLVTGALLRRRRG